MTKLLYRVPEVGTLLSLGRSRTYDMVSKGLIRSVRVNNSIRVPASAIEEFVDSLEPTRRLVAATE